MPHQDPTTRELRQVSAAFRKLARSFENLGSALAAAESVNGASPRRTRRKPRLSHTQRRAFKLQGAYMGTMRGLKPRQRVQVKKIRAAKGVRAAIAAARRMSK